MHLCTSISKPAHSTKILLSLHVLSLKAGSSQSCTCCCLVQARDKLHSTVQQEPFMQKELVCGPQAEACLYLS